MAPFKGTTDGAVTLSAFTVDAGGAPPDIDGWLFALGVGGGVTTADQDELPEVCPSTALNESLRWGDPPALPLVPQR